MLAVIGVVLMVAGIASWAIGEAIGFRTGDTTSHFVRAFIKTHRWAAIVLLLGGMALIYHLES